MPAVPDDSRSDEPASDSNAALAAAAGCAAGFAVATLICLTALIALFWGH